MLIKKKVVLQEKIRILNMKFKYNKQNMGKGHIIGWNRRKKIGKVHNTTIWKLDNCMGNEWEKM